MVRETNSTITHLPTFMNENLQVTLDLMASKFEACQQNRGPTKLKDSMHFRFTSSTETVIVPTPNPLEMMIPLFEHVAVQKGIPQIVSLTAEIYGKMDAEPEFTDCLATQAERDFMKMRDPSGVWKMLHAQTIDIDTGNQCSQLLPYKYDDRGLPVFGQPTTECVKADEAAEYGLIFALLAESRKHVLSLGA